MTPAKRAEVVDPVAPMIVGCWPGVRLARIA
jgi:hypothetical protein